jgi:signal transduction histidine kinase
MHPKVRRELERWAQLVWTRVRPLGAQVRAVWATARATWGILPPIEQFAIVALLALSCGILLSSGRLGGLAPRVALSVVELALVAFLVAIVAEASREIASHRRAASSGAAQLVEQNAELRRQIEESHGRALEINDKVLRRVGVELHDGPAQLICLALLRLDSLDPERAQRCDAAPDARERVRGDYERIRSALQEALAEIRCMAAGLTLPELSAVSPSDALRLAVRNHERRTATSVACEVEGLPQEVPAPIKSCLYRFAQEALNNAYRHAGGNGQTVRGKCCGDTIEVEVADAGPGFEPGNAIVGNRIGLLGMRERVASLGGTLEIVSGPDCGTRLTTRFEMPRYANGG